MVAQVGDRSQMGTLINHQPESNDISSTTSLGKRETFFRGVRGLIEGIQSNEGASLTGRSIRAGLLTKVDTKIDKLRQEKLQQREIAQEQDRAATRIACPKFFSQLFGLKIGDGERNIWVPVKTVANFLRENQSSNSLVDELEEAAARRKQLQERTSDGHTEAQKILQALNRDENQLLVCSKKTNTDGKHALGVRFSQDPTSPDRIICSIFNSGSGLSAHHENILGSKKFDLEYRVTIPRESLTEEVIQSILDDGNTVDHLYKTVRYLDGAERVLFADKKDGRLQVAQKTGNCSTEWIFAYLNYQMDDYYATRQQIFEKAYTDGLNHPETRRIIEKHQTEIDGKVAEKKAKANHPELARQRREALAEIAILQPHRSDPGVEERLKELYPKVRALRTEIYEGLEKKDRK